MMSQANLPISFWGNVWLSVAYIPSKLSSKSVLFTLYELWTGYIRIDSFKTIGVCKLCSYDFTTLQKLDPKSKKYIFIRYSE